jgi:oligo-1,6-glucosidase
LQIYGDFTILSSEHEQVFAYTQTLETSTVFVLLNFQEKEVSFSLPREDWTLQCWKAWDQVLNGSF